MNSSSNPQKLVSGSMFANANDFTIMNSMFNSAGRDFIYNIDSTTDGFRGLHLLYQSMAISAVHDSETSYPPSKCHEGTRVAILTRLANWTTDLGRESQLCWLYGSAGVGKSSVAQTMADRFRHEGKLAASFFFWRRDPIRNNVRKLIPTLAFQIAIFIPALRPAITSAIEANFMILNASLETQFQELILRPFQNLDECGADIPLLVVLDGLDECTDGRDQERVLLLIADVLKSKIPLLFLVTSRPEPRIRRVFDQVSSSHICDRHALEDSDEDIRKYLSDGFAEINSRHKLSTNQHVEQPWPTPRQLDELVYKASGHFIFASTVLKFVDNNFSLPSERLHIILGSTADSRKRDCDSADSLFGPVKPENTERPFRELDRLYHDILSVNPNIQQLWRILGAVVTFPRNSRIPLPTTSSIEQLLGLRSGEVSAALSGMHSLLKIGRDDPNLETIEFAHKSFTDFLLDPERSGEFFIDLPVHHNFMARRCLKLMASPTEDLLGQFSDQLDSEPGRWANFEHWVHHHHWGYHCVSASASPELLHDLRALDPVAYANHLLCLLASNRGKLYRCVIFMLMSFFIGKMRCVQRWLEDHRIAQILHQI
ncbi:hypothetical protein FB446DRAFT_493503 [Lentinula raphanica]|nr:hypothetical protein FB446DRAFT_493503 [Lentinula raphanica]